MHPRNSFELASLQGLLQEIGLKSASVSLSFPTWKVSQAAASFSFSAVHGRLYQQVAFHFHKSQT